MKPANNDLKGGWGGWGEWRPLVMASVGVQGGGEGEDGVGVLGKRQGGGPLLFLLSIGHLPHTRKFIFFQGDEVKTDSKGKVDGCWDAR